jgi:flagellar motility protein MotE (MotC chaperone)
MVNEDVMAHPNAAQEELLDEAEDVGSLLKQLEAMGITCPELIEASIESQTNFKEVVEAQLKASGEVEAMITGIEDYVKSLTARKTRYKKLVDTIREGIAEGLSRSGQKSLVTAFGTITHSRAAPRLNVVKESEVPEHYFGMTLNTTDLKADLVKWQKGYDKLAAIEDETERTEAQAKYLREHKPIPGAELIEGKLTLTIRRK